MPLSIVHSGLLCALYDPAVTEKIREIWAAGQPAVRAWVDSLHSDLMQLTMLNNSMDPDPPPEVLCSIAARILNAMNGWTVSALLFTIENKRSSLRTPQGAGSAPPDALLDKVTEQVALTQDQLQSMLQLLDIFQGLQAPLAQQKAHIAARVSQLLSLGTKMHPMASQSANNTAAAAAAAAAAAPAAARAATAYASAAAGGGEGEGCSR